MGPAQQAGRFLPSSVRLTPLVCVLLLAVTLVVPSSVLGALSSAPNRTEGPVGASPAGLRDQMAPWTNFRTNGGNRGPALAGFLQPSAISGTTWNWAGYVYCPGWNGIVCPRPAPSSEVVGVQGSWTVPTITNTSIGVPEADATWVGIGGAGTSDLVQAGVDGATVGGSPAYAPFWEMAPATSTPIVLSPKALVNAGDRVYVDIRLAGTFANGSQNWSFLMRDNSTDSQWNGTEVCGAGCDLSNLSSADWIQESPYLGPSLLQLPAFTSARLSGARFLTGEGSWTVLTNSTAPVLDISLLDPHYSLSVLGLASPILTPGVFWFEYLVDAEGPAALGRAGIVGITEREPGELLNASMNLSSPDSFSSAPATSIALAVALENSSNVNCFVTPEGYAPLKVSTGNLSYEVQGPICAGIANGYYLTAITLWYVPQGGQAGGNGSLELFSNGFGNGSLLLVNGPAVGPVTVSPPSDDLDVGQLLSLSIDPIGGTPPYTVEWSGLPAGCSSANVVNLTCRTTSAGSATVVALVTDGAGISARSPPVQLAVFADPVVTIVLAAGSSLQGQSVAISSAVAGGDPPFLYAWTGLPPGCGSANASFICSPSASGTYHLELIVRDASDWASEANATLTIDPSLFGVSLWTLGAIVALGAGIAILAAFAVRRRAPRESGGPPHVEGPGPVSPRPPSPEGGPPESPPEGTGPTG